MTSKSVATKRSVASQVDFKVDPSAKFGWEVLSTRAQAALKNTVRNSLEIEKTKAPNTFLAKNGDVRVIFKKDGAVSTVVSVLTSRELQAFK
ncbi:hypothetical protein KXR77_13760 [Xanthomonas euvesicatoria]|uniref:hypothetical protein n=1 Tax=Xanthomonas euvesicatoria TaxID=456327 RepID=UPI000F8DA459|nr:hypothetical protein [Xanthomonas euvesicatoria]